MFKLKEEVLELRQRVRTMTRQVDFLAYTVAKCIYDPMPNPQRGSVGYYAGDGDIVECVVVERDDRRSDYAGFVTIAIGQRIEFVHSGRLFVDRVKAKHRP